jgi:hypothetical protein
MDGNMGVAGMMKLLVINYGSFPKKMHALKKKSSSKSYFPMIIPSYIPMVFL